jgi:hypothetical protein
MQEKVKPVYDKTKSELGAGLVDEAVKALG